MHIAAQFCCTQSLLHAVFTAEFCCLQLFLQIASLRVNSFGQSSAEIYCTQFGAHVFDARRLDAQSFAMLLYYTIAIQLRSYTSAITHLAALRCYCYTTSTLRVNSGYVQGLPGGGAATTGGGASCWSLLFKSKKLKANN